MGIRFQAIVPQQIIGGTGVGDEASAAYAGVRGIEREAFLAQFGAPLPPRAFGDYRGVGRSAIRQGLRLRPQGRYGHHGA